MAMWLIIWVIHSLINLSGAEAEEDHVDLAGGADPHPGEKEFFPAGPPVDPKRDPEGVWGPLYPSFLCN